MFLEDLLLKIYDIKDFVFKINMQSLHIAAASQWMVFNWTFVVWKQMLFWACILMGILWAFVHVKTH